MTNQAIEYIPIKNLRVSPLNMRKSEATKTEDEQLKASIKAYGIKQNLIVYPGKRNIFEVVAGQRRLTQAIALVKEKHFNNNDTIPCQIAQTEQEAIELSIVENTHRAAAHPADEFEAYQAAKEAGSTTKDIANRFGVSQKHVKQRLKLALVAPEIRQEYRDKKLDLEDVMAFTLEDDHKKQLAVLKSFKGERYRLSPHTIRSRLTESAIKSTDAIAKFVDLKTYKSAGGTTSSDLFENTTYLDNRELVFQLAEKKLGTIAEGMADGWLWHEANTTDRYIDTSQYTTLTGTPPEALQEEYKATEKAIDALNEMDPDDWTDELAEQLHDLEAKWSKLEDEIAEKTAFAPEQKALAGFIVCINGAGEPIFHTGLVRKEQLAQLKALESGDAEPNNIQEAETTTEEEPAAESYSQALKEDLAATRKVIAQAHLAQQPELARDIAHYTLCYQILGSTHWGDPINLTARQTFDADKHPTVTQCQGYQLLTELAARLNTNWIHNENDAERLRAFQELPAEDKGRLVAYCIALTLEGGLKRSQASSDIGEHIIDQLNIDWCNNWSPQVENFLGRLSKPALIELAAPFMPERWADAAQKRKKGDLAAELENALAGNDERLSPEQNQLALNWMPAGFC